MSKQLSITQQRLDTLGAEIDRLLALPGSERTMQTYEHAVRLLAVCRKLSLRQWEQYNADNAVGMARGSK